MPINAHPKIERTLAILELIVTTMLAIIVIGALRDTYSPRSQELGAREWTPLVLAVLIPLLLSFTSAGLTMWYHMKYRWLVQLLLITMLFGIGFFLNQ